VFASFVGRSGRCTAIAFMYHTASEFAAIARFAFLVFCFASRTVSDQLYARAARISRRSLPKGVSSKI
jgi:hypothetical protein